jgi:hypothetical protein
MKQAILLAVMSAAIIGCKSKSTAPAPASKPTGFTDGTFEVYLGRISLGTNADTNFTFKIKTLEGGELKELRRVDESPSR